jgi:adenylate kinase family enzyme
MEIIIIGSSNSGKSIIAKLIVKALSIFDIQTCVYDELNQPVDFDHENSSLEFDAKRMNAVHEKHKLGSAITIRMIQAQKKL